MVVFLDLDEEESDNASPAHTRGLWQADKQAEPLAAIDDYTGSYDRPDTSGLSRAIVCYP